MNWRPLFVSGNGMVYVAQVMAPKYLASMAFLKKRVFLLLILAHWCMLSIEPQLVLLRLFHPNVVTGDYARFKNLVRGTCAVDLAEFPV